MGGTFVITLREGFEAALVLGIVYAYLAKIGFREQYRSVTLGAALGAAASALLGAAVTYLSGPLLDIGPDVIVVAVLLTAVVVLTWHGWWMRQHARAIRGDVERRIDAAAASRRVWVVGLIAFTAVFREGAETVLFLWGLFSHTAAGGWSGLVGGVAGVAAAAGLGWAVFRGGTRLSLRRFFAVTSVLILFLAAGLFAAAIGKLAALGVLPQTDALWDTSGVLSEQSPVGAFLNGLIGYRAQPAALEVAGYAAYLAVAGVLIFGSLRAYPARATRLTDRAAR